MKSFLLFAMMFSSQAFGIRIWGQGGEGCVNYPKPGYVPDDEYEIPDVFIGLEKKLYPIWGPFLFSDADREEFEARVKDAEERDREILRIFEKPNWPVGFDFEYNGYRNSDPLTKDCERYFKKYKHNKAMTRVYEDITKVGVGAASFGGPLLAFAIGGFGAFTTACEDANASDALRKYHTCVMKKQAEVERLNKLAQENAARRNRFSQEEAMRELQEEKKKLEEEQEELDDMDVQAILSQNAYLHTVYSPFR